MSLRMLIVDDSSVIRAVVKKSIAMSGLAVAEIFEAGNGVEALKVLEKDWVDIMFADLNMPEMDGVELVRKLAEDKLLGSVPVVIISSDRSATRMDELKQLGVRAFMYKPFRPEQFRQVVTEILGPTKQKE